MLPVSARDRTAVVVEVVGVVAVVVVVVVVEKSRVKLPGAELQPQMGVGVVRTQGQQPTSDLRP